MDGAGAAARAVPAPVCASKFASLTTHVTLKGGEGRSLRVTNLRSARLRILQRLQPRANTAVALLGERICCIYQKASKQGLSPGQRRLLVNFFLLWGIPGFQREYPAGVGLARHFGRKSVRARHLGALLGFDERPRLETQPAAITYAAGRPCNSGETSKN